MAKKSPTKAEYLKQLQSSSTTSIPQVRPSLAQVVSSIPTSNTLAPLALTQGNTNYIPIVQYYKQNELDTNYKKKPGYTRICYIDPPFNSFDYIFSHYFLPTYWYVEAEKPREFYELVLEEAQLVVFDHELNKKDPSIIVYSKAYIKSIISISDWPEKQAYQLIPFKEDYGFPGYTYYDYCKAWTYAFLVRPNTHSWFFQIQFNPKTFHYPSWFIG